jgi:DMSO/TMAO reductase YedYZ molybdopterin-dependent catalytic subunit
MTARRDVLKGLVAAGLLPGPALSALSGELPSGAVESAALEALPGKRPLIKRTFRPPNYETPVEYLGSLYTPNDAFYVRYHLAGVPRQDARTWRLRVGGESARSPREYTLDELRREFAPVELAAVNQCSGNRRGLVDPHVPGIQWSYGAMGNALWKGVRLKDVLERAGVRADAVEVVADGADAGALAATPDFAKSIPVAKALDPDTLIAFEMNGEPLPHWHGFPARLVVPGWTATYWVKHLTALDVVARPFDGFWMKTAYRLPQGAFAMRERFTSQETAANTPITEMVVNSLVTGVELAAGLDVRGIAWDAGYGIDRVELSADDGRTWRRATLGADAGRYSWRQWQYRSDRPGRGRLALLVRATNRVGDTQGLQWTPNPAGYHHNVIQSLTLEVA